MRVGHAAGGCCQCALDKCLVWCATSVIMTQVVPAVTLCKVWKAQRGQRGGAHKGSMVQPQPSLCDGMHKAHEGQWLQKH